VPPKCVGLEILVDITITCAKPIIRFIIMTINMQNRLLKCLNNTA